MALARRGGQNALMATAPHESQASSAARAAAGLIESEPGSAHTLASLARRVGTSPARLHREFVREFGVTPHKYQRAVRVGLMRDGLRAGESVAGAGYGAGFGSSRAIYEHSTAALGMAPSVFRAGGPGLEIRWAVADSRLGPFVVGSTERGVCCVLFVSDQAHAEESLRAEFPLAALRHDGDARGHLERVRALLEGEIARGADVPLDLLGTPFQREVWAELRRIPPGRTASYAQIAARIGRPRAVRAVANTCAGNHAAVVVPCHRVVRADGGLGGYRWGVERKRELLRAETSVASGAGDEGTEAGIGRSD